jgi:hypothetical protein
MGVEPERQSTLAWRKSRHSDGGGTCIEVASTGAFALVRDSHNRMGGAIRVTPTQWYLLLGRIQRDHADCD